MLGDYVYLGAVAIGLCWLLLSKFFKAGRREATLPPGPPTIPVLGNLHVFPKHSVQWKFTEWARQYGDIYSLKLGSKTVIILTDIQAVKELLDKRSLTTADHIPSLASDLVTGGIHMALARYGDVWKILRRVAQTVDTPEVFNLFISRSDIY
ncbi:cytochrome p450 [Moniliophthora roreri MCA 2997]|uniref:Cytochrome p450 n=1 Tax=Moniliophthora roreri (strain MCA 2997) TaxID=1381753 RepID=V2XQJ4_MONRO|nr:cytochrome p450 [Moniliophthora roreri MCA 2997]